MSSSYSAQSPSSQLPASYSLHLTQLPYDATELDIRRMFSENGITSMSIHSVRMVYDHDVHTGRKTVFRGVAFADMKDVEAHKEKVLTTRRNVYDLLSNTCESFFPLGTVPQAQVSF